jgi:hypothetical protein
LKTYFDTGILLKLYTCEKESPSVQRFVYSRAEKLIITDLHISESVSALKLKVFRKECQEEEAAAGIDLLMGDVQSGVLQIAEVDWNHAWLECRILSNLNASIFGVRTLDPKKENGRGDMPLKMAAA